MSEKVSSQDVKKISTNQALKPEGEKLYAELNLPPGEAVDVIRVLSARLVAHRLKPEELAVVDNILAQLRQHGRGARMAMVKVIAGDLAEENLRAGRGLVPAVFKTLLERHGAGALKVVLSNAERTAKIALRRQQAEEWRGS